MVFSFVAVSFKFSCVSVRLLPQFGSRPKAWKEALTDDRTSSITHTHFSTPQHKNGELAIANLFLTVFTNHHAFTQRFTLHTSQANRVSVCVQFNNKLHMVEPVNSIACRWQQLQRRWTRTLCGVQCHYYVHLWVVFHSLFCISEAAYIASTITCVSEWSLRLPN